MSASMAAFTLNDTIMKMVSENLTLFQAIFIRGIFATLFIALLAHHKGAFTLSLSKQDRRIVCVRLVAELGATLCFLQALFNMPLANATAILQALPLTVTLAAALFLGEPVGWRRYWAIIIGFIGILIIVRPGSDGFNEYSFWAIAAVIFVTLRDLATRKLSRQVPSLFVAFMTSIAITITGALLSPTMEWKPVDASAIGLLLLAASFLIFGYLFSVMTMRIGEISVVSPFRYTALIWAILLGYIVFEDIPDSWTLFGSAIVILMGIYTFYRERQIRKTA